MQTTVTVGSINVDIKDLEKLKATIASEGWTLIEEIWTKRIDEALSLIAIRNTDERETDFQRGVIDAHKDILSFRDSLQETLDALK